MADTVAITAGAGTSIATDDCAGVHYQQVKLVASALDSTEALSKAEDAAHTTGDHGIQALAVRQSDANSLSPTSGSDGDYNPLQVNSRGSLLVENRPRVARIRTVSASLTTATTLYTAGDQLGDIMEIAGCATVSGGTGEIRSITVLDKGDSIFDIALWFFRATVTVASNNAAWAVSDADMESLIGVVHMPAFRDMGANRVSTLGGVGLAYDCAATSLFCAMETRTTHTGHFAATTDLHVILTVVKD